MALVEPQRAQRPVLGQDAPDDGPSYEDGGSTVGEKLATLAAGIAGFATGFLAGQKGKHADGARPAADDAASNNALQALPYQWASQSAEFGLEFVRKALEVGEGLPMIGACFTLCLIIAKSAEAVYAVRALPPRPNAPAPRPRRDAAPPLDRATEQPQLRGDGGAGEARVAHAGGR